MTDERAVLKNFEWPEAKYDTMREATASHMELLAVKSNCQNWQCGAEPCEVECSKISAYFDKVHVARSPYLDKVHDAGGWKRYEQAHRKQLVSLFAPKLRLPTDVIPLVVDFWANVGMY